VKNKSASKWILLHGRKGLIEALLERLLREKLGNNRTINKMASSKRIYGGITGMGDDQAFEDAGFSAKSEDQR
jgi:hypothetical protein